jgi:hypothetical protein
MKPEVVVGSPMCTMFSTLQSFTPWTRKKRQEYQQAVKHTEFVASIYKIQIEGGRYILHEQPIGASSWKLKAIVDIGNMEGVEEVVTDQCMFGLTTWTRGKRRAAARKRTRFLTNAECVADEIQRSCRGEHEHQPLTGGRAGPPQEYPRELCRAICRGIVKQLKMKSMSVKSVLRLEARVVGRDTEFSDKYHDGEEQEIGKRMAAWEDLTGVPLNPKKVMEARQKELEYISDRNVWTVISREVAKRNGWKIIKTRWIDINKGDDVEVIYRSRLVGKEFNDRKVDELFAGTPPLEALRYLVHEAATIEKR